MKRLPRSNSDGLTEAVFVFQLIQYGNVFMTLVAGIVCLGHIVFVLRKSCLNAGFLFALTFACFCHILVCGHLKVLALETAYRTRVNVCIDYSLPAMIANAGIFMLIIHKISLHIAATSVVAAIIRVFSFCSILAGLVFTFSSSVNQGMTLLNQVSFMSILATPNSHLDASWLICEKRVSREITNVIIEYLFVYLPVVVVAMWAFVRRFRRTKEISCLKVVILSNKECGSKSGTCACDKLNAGLVLVLSFNAILLLIVKPGYMVYAHATSGNFRDLISSLLPMALLQVICIEYILKVIVQRGRGTIWTQECNRDHQKTVCRLRLT
ncbi:uncharacterized protein LOC127868567 [Dreissena polymorpha]|uniref:Uncharacterized protein n=1 Tax=Dreissena polymorpha TaxID=45954 RepID=A0A9D4M6D6_DREPO|nr:uncharacterized protein LOC127868567 [Dreissena polymorpha]KAH3871732.1 hypothetical protein DPMN_034944 [Dreissena polymorpha]